MAPDQSLLRSVVKSFLPHDDDITLMHRLPVNDNGTVGAHQTLNRVPQGTAFRSSL
jgi:hypothetical protein